MDAPGIPDEPRDASSAACIAAALYEISITDVPDAESYTACADSLVTATRKGKTGITATPSDDPSKAKTATVSVE
jgi:hypothetical protein